MEVKLTRYTENPIQAMEEAASNCYDSNPTNGYVVNQCYESGHQSVLEFADFTFHITGVSRVVLAELSRHRMQSLCVRSQRYTKEDGFNYYIPESIKNKKELLKKYEEFMNSSDDLYNYFLLSGVVPEDARYVLPNACHTVIECKFNGRSLINFMNLRLCTRAQYEIREMANKMKKEVGKVCPEFAKYLVPKCEAHLKYPFCTEKKSCGLHRKLEDVYRAEQ